MAKLKSRDLTPPKGPFFIDGQVYLNGGSYDETEKLIEKHRRANGLPPGNPRQELENFTCERWRSGCYKDTGWSESPQQRKLTEQANDFLSIYGKWAAQGFPTVDQVEANHRADTCWKCPANQKVTVEEQKKGCCSKQKTVSILGAVSKQMAKALLWPALRNRVTPADNELFSCNVCGCPNKASVWLPLSVYEYDTEMTEKFRQANSRCWKIKK